MNFRLLFKYKEKHLLNCILKVFFEQWNNQWLSVISWLGLYCVHGKIFIYRHNGFKACLYSSKDIGNKKKMHLGLDNTSPLLTSECSPYLILQVTGLFLVTPGQNDKSFKVYTPVLCTNINYVYNVCGHWILW